MILKDEYNKKDNTGKCIVSFKTVMKIVSYTVMFNEYKLYLLLLCSYLIKLNH